MQCLYRTAVSGRVAVHTSERRVEPAVWLVAAVPGCGFCTQIPRGPGFRKFVNRIMSLGHALLFSLTMYVSLVLRQSADYFTAWPGLISLSFTHV